MNELDLNDTDEETIVICHWYQASEEERDHYETACGEEFLLFAGAPSDNDMRYCCYCGGVLEEVFIETQDQDPEST